MKYDFQEMSKSELRSYVIAHPNDKNAFYVFVDRFTKEASPQTFDLPQSESDLEEIDKLIQDRLR